MNKTDEVLNLVSKTADKFEEADKAYKQLYRMRSREHYRKFMALSLLDCFLTVVDLKDLESYKEYRGKGYV